MDWLRHPSFAAERGRVLSYLRRDRYDFLSIKKVVFLCGAFGSTRRESLKRYLDRHDRTVLLFYAEDVWSVIAGLPDTNALAMEEKLASLADLVVVIVESAGTFAEVGAFAISEPLRSKLLPIVDVSYRHSDSFITTGPIRWVDGASRFSPTIWVDLNRILEAIPEIQERLERVPKQGPAKIANLRASPKHLLFFVCDLVAVFGPCPREHVEAMLDDLIPGSTPVDVGLLLGLARAMGLLAALEVDGRAMYVRVLKDGELVSFQRKRHIDLATLRAQVLGAMSRSTQGRAALTALAVRP